MKFDKKQTAEKMKGTFVGLLDVVFIETADDNRLEATMRVRSDLLQAAGVLHGGVTIAFAETVSGVGSNLLCGNDEFALGMQISASHLKSAYPGDVIRAIGSIQHKGKTTHVWNVDVVSEETGKLISTIRITNAVVKNR